MSVVNGNSIHFKHVSDLTDDCITSCLNTIFLEHCVDVVCFYSVYVDDVGILVAFGEIYALGLDLLHNFSAVIEFFFNNKASFNAFDRFYEDYSENCLDYGEHEDFLELCWELESHRCFFIFKTVGD